MIRYLFFLFLISLVNPSITGQTPTDRQFTLDDFFRYHPALDRTIDEIIDDMNDTLLVGQMIVPAVGKHGKPTEHVMQLAKKGWIGGVLLLNGTVASFTQFVQQFDSVAQAHHRLPFLYSADAEPTLIRYKIKNSTPVPKTNEIHTAEEVSSVAETIAGDLNTIGITQNFAPVIDASPNQTVSNRSFGLNMDTVIAFSKRFISAMQQANIVATAKHFPGHGFVKGDTHEKLVYIDGEMKEVNNYVPLIEDGVLSIMIAHIAVKNNDTYNTHGLPSTCSRKIVTDLLKRQLRFRGLVITDAMNMGGVRNVPQSGLKAITAGCDMLLMPVDEANDIYSIVAAMQQNRRLYYQVRSSVKKIIRLKICLGLIPS